MLQDEYVPKLHKTPANKIYITLQNSFVARKEFSIGNTYVTKFQVITINLVFAEPKPNFSQVFIEALGPGLY